MANIVLPTVNTLTSLNNNATLLVEQDGIIQRYNFNNITSINNIQNDRLNTIESNINTLENTIKSLQTLINTTATNLQNKIPDVKLNYSVIGGTSRPTNPTENTFWVKTSQPITQWLFQSNVPSSANVGTVLFNTTTHCHISFYSLLVNNQSVDPIYVTSVIQYYNNKWNNIDCEIYQNGSWKTLMYYIYNYGQENTQLISAAGTGSSVTKNVDKISMIGNYGTNWTTRLSTIYTKDPIDLTPYSTFNVVCDWAAINNEIGRGQKLCISTSAASFSSPTETNYNNISGVINTAVSSKQTITYDISNLKQTCYIGFYNYGGSGNVYQLYLQ